MLDLEALVEKAEKGSREKVEESVDDWIEKMILDAIENSDVPVYFIKVDTEKDYKRYCKENSLRYCPLLTKIAVEEVLARYKFRHFTVAHTDNFKAFCISWDKYGSES